MAYCFPVSGNARSAASWEREYYGARNVRQKLQFLADSTTRHPFRKRAMSEQ
jgi:hypothetical protein